MSRPLMKLLSVALLLVLGKTFAQEPVVETVLQDAVLQTKADIDKANAELQALRDRVASERKPLATRLESLQQEVKVLRAEAQRARTLRQQGEKEQAALVAEAETLNEQCRFVLALLSEYRRAMETRATVSESAWLADSLKTVDQHLVDKDAFQQLPSAVDNLLDLSTDWNAKRFGGTAFSGAALDEGGMELSGTFTVLGPLSYFGSSDGTRAGLVVTRLGLSHPSIYESISPSAQQALILLSQGNEAIVPVDVTSGDALKVEQARQGFVEHVKKGGFVIIPLLVVGALAIILALWKFIDLSRVRVRADAALETVVAHIKAGDIQAARVQAMQLNEPLAGLVQAGIELRDAPREHLEEIMHEHVLSNVPRLERHLGTLAVFGGIAPLLGLLGTVTGMIHTFQLVTLFGSGDAKLLSGGISEALVTTEFGLAIAIPVLLVHAFLSRRARNIIGLLEQTALGLVNDLKVRTVKA